MDIKPSVAGSVLARPAFKVIDVDRIRRLSFKFPVNFYEQISRLGRRDLQELLVSLSETQSIQIGEQGR